MRNVSVLMSGWVSLLVLGVLTDAVIVRPYGRDGQQRQSTRNPFGQYRQPVPTMRTPYGGQYRQPVPTMRTPYGGQYRQQVPTMRTPYGGQYRQQVPTTRTPYGGQFWTQTPYRNPIEQDNSQIWQRILEDERKLQVDFDLLRSLNGRATTQKTPRVFIRLVAGNESQTNSTFINYVCRNGVCVKYYTAGFYSTVSVGGILALLILSACVGSAVVVRRRRVAALHYSVISDADARPLLGRGLSIQSDPVLLARV